jgi:hypothetical protein
MIVLIVLIAVIIILTATVYVFGFHVGGEHWHSELVRVRVEAAQAERRLYDLTRKAFVAMAEHVERHKP